MSEMTTRQDAKALYEALNDMVEALQHPIKCTGAPEARDALYVAHANAVVLVEALEEDYGR